MQAINNYSYNQPDLSRPRQWFFMYADHVTFSDPEVTTAIERYSVHLARLVQPLAEP